MNKDEIMNLDMEALTERSSAIAEETREASKETLEELNAELDVIEERKKAIEAEAAEKRAKEIAVIEGAGEVIEATKEERKTMDEREIRNSKEYIDAYVEYIKGNTDGEECRALLTENAQSGGTIAVPVYIEDKIQTAWENDQIMSRVKRTAFKGNLKVGYEASSDGAVLHSEGGEAIDPENLVISYINLVPTMVKKLVEISDEVMDMKGQAFLDYLYDEIEYQIVKLCASTVVEACLNSSLAATVTLGAAAAVTDIVNAEGSLGGEASNPVVITTRSNAAAYKALALNANYGFDVFDGMPVLYCDAADLGGAQFIIADLNGVQANFPDGGEIKFKFDDLTKAAEDIIRIIGRLYVAIDVIAPGKVVVAGLDTESE